MGFGTPMDSPQCGKSGKKTKFTPDKINVTRDTEKDKYVNPHPKPAVAGTLCTIKRPDCSSPH
jgi:hypothetical protein